ncbi:MAG: hypothetical protein ACXVX4_06100 [Mycobacterium sp.]
MTEWPVAVDRRYHDAVIFGLDCVITQTAPGVAEARDSTAVFLRRLRDVGVATAVYSSTRDCAPLLRAAGIEELVGVAVGAADTAGQGDAALTMTVARLGYARSVASSSTAAAPG